MAFLHQLFIAAQFTITQLSPCAVDILAKFLHLSQLDKLVASSHGTLHKQTMQMEAVINQFGDLEGKKLALKMPKKKITLCEDETFHPEICLVAMEPVSNFILLEAYSERRDGDSWSAAIKEALTQWHYLKLRHALRSIYHGFSLIWFLQLFVVSASLEMASIAA